MTDSSRDDLDDAARPLSGLWSNWKALADQKKAFAAGNRGLALSAEGRLEEALSAQEEAVAINRLRAEARPGALGNLAISLDEQAIVLSELGRHHEALALSAEAVAICRQRAEARPKNLVWSLQTYSRVLRGLDRSYEALAAIEEALAAARCLPEPQSKASQSYVAESQSIKASVLLDLGRREEAQAAMHEADRFLD